MGQPIKKFGYCFYFCWFWLCGFILHVYIRVKSPETVISLENFKEPFSGSSNLLGGSVHVWSQLTAVCHESDDTDIWNVFLLFGKFCLKMCKIPSRTSLL